MTDTYSVEFVDSSHAVPEHLWSTCFAPLVEGQWWYETLEQSGLEGQFTFLYAIVRRQGEAVGLAPVFVMNVPISLVVPPEILPIVKFGGKLLPSILHQRTLFIGSPCSDEGTVGFAPGVDTVTAMLSLQDAFDRKAAELGAPMLVWKDFPDELAGALEIVSAKRGLFRLVSFPGAVIQLKSRRKEDYYAGMKASRRQKLKRKLRLSAQAVETSVTVIQKPDAAVLDEIFALFSQTYAKATTKFERLDRKFFEVIAEKPVSHFILIRENPTGALLAFMLCFATGERLINKFIGIDYARPKDWFLYFRLWDAAVDWALAHGFTSIQSGQTGYSAKIELGNHLVPLTNYCRHRNKLTHFVYRKVAQSVSWRTLDDDLADHLKAHPEEAPRSHRSDAAATKSAA